MDTIKSDIRIISIVLLVCIVLGTIRNCGVPLTCKFADCIESKTLSRILGNSISWMKTELPGSKAIEISVKDAHDVLWPQTASLPSFDDNVIFIDARSREQFAKERISGSFNIPWNEFDYKSTALLVSKFRKDKKYLVYCESHQCWLGPKLADRLVDMGFSEIYICREGIQGWKKKGFETKKKEGFETK